MTISAKPRCAACSAIARSRKPQSPAQGSSAAQRIAGQRDELVEVILEDRVDQGGLAREAAVERADADTGTARDLLHARLEAVGAERLVRRADDPLAVLGGVAAQWTEPPVRCGIHVPLMVRCPA